MRTWLEVESPNSGTAASTSCTGPTSRYSEGFYAIYAAPTRVRDANFKFQVVAVLNSESPAIHLPSPISMTIRQLDNLRI